MNSGNLRHRVSILRATTAADSFGYPVETWSSIAEVWGEFREERATEVLKSERPTAFSQGILFLRYRADITAKDKVQCKGKTWDILNVRTLENMRRNEGLELALRTND